MLELDELWTFVGHRRRGGALWLWLALCPGTPAGPTRQVVAFALGARDDATCEVLRSRIPAAYRHATFHTDPLESYYHVLPSRQHQAHAKGGGQTNHIERFNHTLRQRLARLMRKSLSFSKCARMLAFTIEVFLHRYNTEIRFKYQG